LLASPVFSGTEPQLRVARPLLRVTFPMPMSRYLVGLALWSAALAATDSGHCVDDACRTADHSLLQVSSGSSRVGRPKGKAGIDDASEMEQHDKAPAGLVELEAGDGARSRATLSEENRTIQNITGTVDSELDLLDFNVHLLNYAQHKLCAAEGMDGARVKTLENMMKVQALLQETAVDDPPQTLGAVERETSKSRDQSASSEARAQDKAKFWPSWFFPKKDKATEMTLENITSDVGGEVKQVEVLMAAIAEQKDKNEVLSSRTSERLKTLISVLTVEVKDCDVGGFIPNSGSPDYGMAQAGEEAQQTDEQEQAGQSDQRDGSPPTMAQAGQEVQQGDDQAGQSDQQTQMTEQAEGDDAGLALLQKHEKSRQKLPPFLLTGGNLTLKNISTNIGQTTTSMEADLAALMRQKNKLGVADSKGVEKLQNLEAGLGIKPDGLVAVQTKAHKGREASDKVATIPSHNVIQNSTLGDVDENIEKEVKSLQGDIDTITWEKHLVCTASLRYMQRIERLIAELGTMEC